MKTVVKRTSYMVVLLALFSITFFFNAGKYLDVTQKPVTSDIVACMGGGTPERVIESTELYNEGYSKQNLLLLPGEPRANKNYIQKNHPEIRFIVKYDTKNTAEEIRYIKKYMAKHHYKSVIIVSDPPHIRRIKILTNLISVKGDEEFSYVFVGSGVTWWHPNKYYKNKKALRFALSEALRIPYTYVYYGLLEKIGFKWSESEYKVLKKKFGELMNGELFRSGD